MSGLQVRRATSKLLVAWVSLSAFDGCATRPASDPAMAVARVLAEDARQAARTESERALLEFWDPALPYKRQASRMEAIPLRGCPEDFSRAYTAHSRAFSQAGESLNAATNWWRTVEGPTMSRDQVERAVAIAEFEIGRTRGQLERVSSLYRPPHP